MSGVHLVGQEVVDAHCMSVARVGDIAEWCVSVGREVVDVYCVSVWQGTSSS